jgi:hypothetical protein
MRPAGIVVDTPRFDQNLVACFAYTLTKATDEPLLLKRDIFVHTDVAPTAERAIAKTQQISAKVLSARLELFS